MSFSYRNGHAYLGWIQPKISHSSKAACALQAQFRWIVSSTDVEKDSTLYESLVKFLRLSKCSYIYSNTLYWHYVYHCIQILYNAIFVLTALAARLFGTHSKRRNALVAPTQLHSRYSKFEGMNKYMLSSLSLCTIATTIGGEMNSVMALMTRRWLI